MPELIFEHAVRVEDADGGIYVPRTYGQARGDGTWAGWIEFHPLDGEGVVLRTDQETSQPKGSSGNNYTTSWGNCGTLFKRW